MTHQPHRNLHIAGTGKYLPKEVVHSQALDQKLAKAPGWVARKSGVAQRYFASPEETTSFMAAEAAQQALARANIQAEQLDCVIGACSVMEQAIPGTAVLVQKRLHLEHSGIAAFDVNSTCLSFFTAL